jgi:hypothetical protein
VYVDAMPIAADSMAVIRNVRELLTTKWQWPDIGEAAIILGFKIEHDPAAREIELIQGAYIQGLLEPFDIKDPNAVRTPEESFSLVKAELSIGTAPSLGRYERSRSNERGTSRSWNRSCGVLLALSPISDSIRGFCPILWQFDQRSPEAAKRVLTDWKIPLRQDWCSGRKQNNEKQLFGYSNSDYAEALDSAK